MSHCTKFNFTFSDEKAIVKSFKKLGIRCSTELISEYNSDYSKKILGKIGYLGNKQFRAICGSLASYQLFMCKIEPNHYELFIEKSTKASSHDLAQMNQIAEDFRKAYIEVAIDEIVSKLDKGNMPSKISVQKNQYLIEFGPMYEYQLSIVFDNGEITEDVKGIKGDFCTKLTEDIENILSHPESELRTEWKQEHDIMIEDKNIQVLELTF